VSEVIDGYKENFYLDSELLFDWLIWFASYYPSFSL
jgi:hypothetical protein